MKGIKRWLPYTGGIAGALLFSYCQFQEPQTDAPLQPANGVQFSIPELVENLIEVDALDDRKLEGEYTATLQAIDDQCLERPQTIVLEAMKRVEADDMIGSQYAVLNVLEDVEFAAESSSEVVECLNFL